MSPEKRQGPSWKHPQASGQVSTSRKREWHPAPGTGSVARPRHRSVWLPALLGSALLAAIVAAILLLRPAKLPVFVVVAPDQVETLAVPPNVMGASASKALTAWASETPGRPRVIEISSEQATPDSWGSSLTDCPEKSVVVFMSLHGGVDGDGQPFLWFVPATARSPQPAHRLRLTDILNRLSQLPVEQNKVLILDATQVSASWPHGQFHNDFARALKQLDAQIESIPNLVVLASSDVDQRSWLAEEWQLSIFAQLFIEGLKGAAGVDRVTLDRLYDFLDRELPAWTQAHRGERQTPLLLPTESGRRRAERIELASVSAKQYAPPDPRSAPGASMDVPQGLAEAWQRCEKLTQESRRPEAVAPIAWRRYVDTLLRVEQMARQGLPAAKVQEIVQELAREEASFQRNPWPDLTSVNNALPFASVLASVRPSNPRPVVRLLADPVNEWPSWREAAARNDLGLVALRREIAAALLQEVISSDSPQLLNQASKALEVVFGPEPVPVEAHLVRLLARDLEASHRPPAFLIRLALQVHRLAEEASCLAGTEAMDFPAVELVFSWIEREIESADTDRLLGFDHLLSGVPADWPKAEELLNQASKKYQAAAQKAREVRRGLAVRDMVFAQLPYYARWVAGLRDEFPSTERDRLLHLVESIGDGVHRLAGQLTHGSEVTIEDLMRSTTAVQEQWGDLTHTFSGFVAKLNGEVLISNWHHLDNVLQVPWIPARRRLELLGYLRNVSLNLHVGAKEIDPRTVRRNEDGKDRAIRQGRVALAVLGRTALEESDRGPAAGRPPRFQEMRQMLLAPKSEWWQTVHEVGVHVGKGWLGLAGRIESLLAESRRSGGSSARMKAAHADLLGRVASSVAAVERETDPTTTYRRLRLHDFLLFQAKRTIRANWGAVEIAAKKSYAEELTERFLADAKQLIQMELGVNASPEEQARFLVDVKQLAERLPIPQPTLSALEAVRDLTNQQRSIRLRFAVSWPKDLPQGLPAMRFESSGPVRLSAEASTRRLLKEWNQADMAAPRVEPSLEVELNFRGANVKESVVNGWLWYRGHRWQSASRLRLSREPSAIWVYQPRRGPATFAVRAAPDVRAGAIAIVLDWSRSMKTAGPDGRTRYDQALAALQTVLAALPPDTVVSIRQFGTPGGESRPLRIAARPYDFPNNPGQLADLIQQLGRHQPDGINTPLARAIVDAIDDLPVGSDQYRTIVALTDGEDNVDNAEAGQRVAAALKGKGIDVRLVIFQATETEFAKVRSQFEEIVRMDPPGRIVAAADQKSLAVSLNDAMRPRVRVVAKDESAITPIRERGSVGVPVTLYGANLEEWWRPGLPPGVYQLRSTASRADMWLSPGDRLLVEMARAEGRLVFRNRLYVTEAIPRDGRNLLAQSQDGQRVHVGLANVRLVRSDSDEGKYDLDMLVLAERERKGDEIRATYPKFTWIEVRTQNENAQGELPVRMENRLQFPTPAFHVRVRHWPALPGQVNVRQSPSRPALTLWWRDTMPRDPHLIRRDPRKSLTEDLAQRTFTVEGQQVTLEEVRIENNELFLQIGHAPGRPVVFVRPEELHDLPAYTLAEEHRFYSESGKYTARFGPLSEAEQKRAFTLQFFSIAELKRDASRVELRPQVSPDTSDLLGQDTPRPIVSID